MWQFGGRPGLAVSGDRTIDQPRIDLLQRRAIQLESPHHPRAEIFDQNIRAGGQLADDINRVRRFQVEHQAFLAGIELAEHRTGPIADRRAGPHRLTLHRLDLDDFRAHVGQHPGAVWTGDRSREVEDAKSLEALCQNTLIVSCYRYS